MSDDKLNPLDCPEDRLYFLNDVEFQRSDLGALDTQELVATQGDTYRMLEMMYLRMVAPPESWFLKRLKSDD
jgi:hypothetical protein